MTVRVPVLSEAITVQLPNDSTAFNFFTITFFLSILLDATVRAIVRASDKPSGIADTARAITLKNISFKGKSLLFKTNATIIATTKIIQLICLENLSVLIVSGDFSSFVSDTLLAILPISVLVAVDVTTANALPVVTVVPAYTIFILSAKAVSSFNFLLFLETATLSPVKADSFT